MPNMVYNGPQAANGADRYTELIGQTSGQISVDIETVSLDNREPLGVGIAPNPDEAFYFPVDSHLLPWHVLENPRITKLFHNGHFDLGVFRTWLNTSIAPVYDTIVAAQLLGFPPALGTLARLFYGVELPSIEDLIGKRGKSQATMDQVPIEKVAQKCCNDVRYTYRIWETLKNHLPWAAFQLEMDLMPVLARMEDEGVRIDVNRLHEHRRTVSRDVEFYKGIAQGMGFNPGSSLQVAAVLQDRGWEIRYKRQTGKPMLNEEMLSTVYAEDPVSQLVLLYRRARVLLSTFINATIDKHLDGDRVYSRINQALTNSGRLSRTKPNLQNIPPKMRDIFIASEGNVLEDWDLNQIELRDLAFKVHNATGDYTMQRVFDQGGDIHSETCRQLVGPLTYENRRLAKEGNFASVYRGDEYTLYRHIGVPPAKGVEFLARYFAHYWGINLYYEQVCQQLQRDGYTETMLGRKRYLPEIESPFGWQREKAKREGFNHKIQGTAAEIIKRLQVKNRNMPQCNQIHDEIIFDVKPDQQLDRATAVGLAPYKTPMRVSRGLNWADLQEVGTWGS